MEELSNYLSNLSRAFDYLSETAEKNSFYTPTRQYVCQTVYKNSQRDIKSLELAIKYLTRRLEEQGMEKYLQEEVCKNVFLSNFWQKRWPANTIVLASGEEGKQYERFGNVSEIKK